MIAMVLGTDMSSHFKEVAKLRGRLEAKGNLIHFTNYPLLVNLPNATRL